MRSPRAPAPAACLLLTLLTASSASANCIISDLPDCPCDTTFAPWPLVPVVGDIVATARLTAGMKASCARHRGQPYWQVQQLLTSPAGAHTLAHAHPDFVQDNPTQAWCTETVAYWHALARIPYGPAGYSTTGLAGARNHHPSPLMRDTEEIRLYYKEEERLRTEDGLATRGRWIDGQEIDYDDFEPGVNGPCPGAYQQLESGSAIVAGYWLGTGTSHSQVVDSMIIYREGGATGPVVRVDLRVVEGNIGLDSIPDTLGVKFLRSRIKNSKWYQDVADYTRFGDTFDSSNRKIRGWGIDLTAAGAPDYDPDYVRTVVTYLSASGPAPAPPDTSDDSKISVFRGYHMATGGNIVVFTNSTMVTTGGTLAHPANHWIIPAGPHPVDPVNIDIDLLANHPHRVRGVKIDWKDGKVPQFYEVWWAEQNGQIHMKSVVRGTAVPPSPPGETLPDRVAFAPDSGYVVRHARLRIANAALVEPYEVVAFSYDFWTGAAPEDSGRSSPDDADNPPPPTGIAPEGDAGAAIVAIEPVSSPNPFRESTTIAFTSPRGAFVRVFAPDGRLVRRLVPAAGAGPRASVVWDGRDDRGRRLPSGTYLYEVVAGSVRAQGRTTLLR